MFVHTEFQGIRRKPVEAFQKVILRDKSSALRQRQLQRHDTGIIQSDLAAAGIRDMKFNIASANSPVRIGKLIVTVTADETVRKIAPADQRADTSVIQMLSVAEINHGSSGSVDFQSQEPDTLFSKIQNHVIPVRGSIGGNRAETETEIMLRIQRLFSACHAVGILRGIRRTENFLMTARFKVIPETGLGKGLPFASAPQISRLHNLHTGGRKLQKLRDGPGAHFLPRDTAFVYSGIVPAGIIEGELLPRKCPAGVISESETKLARHLAAEPGHKFLTGGAFPRTIRFRKQFLPLINHSLQKRSSRLISQKSVSDIVNLHGNHIFPGNQKRRDVKG